MRFPSYEQWRATGERTDVIDGRVDVRTVFYERDGREIAYAIVAGPALSPEDTLRSVAAGRRRGGHVDAARAHVRDRGVGGDAACWLGWPSGSAGEVRTGEGAGFDARVFARGAEVR